LPNFSFVVELLLKPFASPKSDVAPGFCPLLYFIEGRSAFDAQPAALVLDKAAVLATTVNAAKPKRNPDPRMPK
jgi:hypothetical protein